MRGGYLGCSVCTSYPIPIARPCIYTDTGIGILAGYRITAISGCIACSVPYSYTTPTAACAGDMMSKEDNEIER
jgi:hypothetical protein